MTDPLTRARAVYGLPEPASEPPHEERLRGLILTVLGGADRWLTMGQLNARIDSHFGGPIGDALFALVDAGKVQKRPRANARNGWEFASVSALRRWAAA